MSEELTMPRLSDTMEEGRIARWLKAEGDTVSMGEVVAEIETDKATMEFQSYSEGTLLKILVPDGETAPLGAPIAVVGEPGEAVSDGGSANGGSGAAEAGEAPAEAEEAEEAPSPEAAAEDDGEGELEGRGPEPGTAEPDEKQKQEQEPAPTERAADGGDGRRARLRVSPIARRMADEAGVDLRPLAGRGSGPEGRIVRSDVERLIEEGGAPSGDGEPKSADEAADERRPAPQAAPSPDGEPELREPSRLLRAVARRMAEAHSTVPHFYVSTEIDMSRAVALRKELNEGLSESGEKVSVNDLVIRAVAAALLEHPQAHRSWVDGKLAYHQHANVGIAVALEDGLVVPVLKAADTKGIRQLAREARDLAGRAREGKLKQSEIEGGTFTVSNLGMFGVTDFHAIINPPESGILAVGAAVERPVVDEGEVVTRPIMQVTLSCDHRACSGADGARLLQTVKRLLEGGALLLA
jgi:pyruvate dehydrogenase E2 component (dihydrolipoamide acetyltransferase)